MSTTLATTKAQLEQDTKKHYSETAKKDDKIMLSKVAKGLNQILADTSFKIRFLHEDNELNLAVKAPEIITTKTSKILQITDTQYNKIISDLNVCFINKNLPTCYEKLYKESLQYTAIGESEEIILSIKDKTWIKEIYKKLLKDNIIVKFEKVADLPFDTFRYKNILTKFIPEGKRGHKDFLYFLEIGPF